ncbi:TPA: hypothetical protein N2N45_002417 [Klebsiella aerogenes]|nr:hypothetical protein [Klebsiella aerogenes]
MSSWNEVRATQAYLDASPEKREAIHNDYFQRVVAPNARAKGYDVDAIYRDYMANTELTPYYNHETKADMSQGEWFDNQIAQIGDLYNGGKAYLNKWTGSDYSQEDINQFKRAISSEAGEDLTTEAAIAASIVAPELIPEIAGGMLLGEGASLASRGIWLANSAASNIASSAAYQLVDSGDINVSDLGRDAVIGMGLEGGASKIANSVFSSDRYINKATSAVVKDTLNTEKHLENIARSENKVHAAEQIKTLAGITESAKEVYPEATAGDALRAWVKAAPEMHDMPMAARYDDSIRPEVFNHVYGHAGDLTPLQQVVAVLTDAEISPVTTVGEMADLVSGMTPEQMMAISKQEVNLAERAVKQAQRDMGKFNGRFKDIADTQALIKDNSKLWDRVFSSDINSYDSDVLDELGVNKTTRLASRVSGMAEGLPVVTRMARDAQFNRIAERYSNNMQDALGEILEERVAALDNANKELQSFRSSGSLEDIARARVLGSRSSAFGHGVRNVEDLASEIKNVRKGLKVSEDPFNNAMYNSQLRKFASFVDPTENLTSQGLKDASRKVKLLAKTATAKRSLKDAVERSTLSFVATDFIVENVLGAASGVVAIGKAALTGAAVKRMIDGAVNKALAIASDLMESDSFLTQIQSEIDDWSESFAKSKGRKPTQKETSEQIDEIVRDVIPEYVDSGSVINDVAERLSPATGTLFGEQGE